MKEVHSAGFLIFKATEGDKFQFLLLNKKNNELDLPKGHLEKKETPMQAAQRELKEETGISASDYIIDEKFIFEDIYFPFYKRFKEKVEKKLTIYLGKYLAEKKLKMTEHSSFNWVDYNPPHKFSWPPSLGKLFEKIEEYEKEGNLEIFLKRMNHFFDSSY